MENKNKLVKSPFDDKLEVASSSNLTCYMIGADVFYVYFNPNLLNSVDEMRFVFDTYNKIVEQKQTLLKVIIELSEFAQIDKLGREYLEVHTTKGICEAVVITNIAQRLLINFYFKMKSHNNPSRVFKNREKAFDWANTF